MATILANLCFTLTIPRNRAINLRFLDSELISRHINRRFIVNLGVSYYERIRHYTGECSDEELIDRMIIHSYNDRIAEKKNDRHIRNSILFDFVESSLKGTDGYMNALQIVYNQEPMQGYLSNYVILVVADWPGQFFICKAIAQRVLVENENVPEFIMSFLSIMGLLHVSLNARELVFLKNSRLFNDIYKGIFGGCKELGMKLWP